MPPKNNKKERGNGRHEKRTKGGSSGTEKKVKLTGAAKREAEALFDAAYEAHGVACGGDHARDADANPEGLEAARALYLKALEARPDDLDILANLGHISFHLARLAGPALDTCARWLSEARGQYERITTLDTSGRAAATIEARRALANLATYVHPGPRGPVPWGSAQRWEIPSSAREAVPRWMSSSEGAAWAHLQLALKHKGGDQELHLLAGQVSAASARRCLDERGCEARPAVEFAARALEASLGTAECADGADLEAIVALSELLAACADAEVDARDFATAFRTGTAAAHWGALAETLGGSGGGGGGGGGGAGPSGAVPTLPPARSPHGTVFAPIPGPTEVPRACDDPGLLAVHARALAVLGLAVATACRAGPPETVDGALRAALSGGPSIPPCLARAPAAPEGGSPGSVGPAPWFTGAPSPLQAPVRADGDGPGDGRAEPSPAVRWEGQEDPAQRAVAHLETAWAARRPAEWAAASCLRRAHDLFIVAAAADTSALAERADASFELAKHVARFFSTNADIVAGANPDTAALASRAGLPFLSLAADLYTQCVDADPSDATSSYNLGCVLAQAGNGEECARRLSAAVDAGAALKGDLESDEDLAPMRAESWFAELVAKARAA